MKRVFLIAVCLLFLVASVFSKTRFAEERRISLHSPMDIPLIQERFHCAGNVYLTITNWGFFGSQRGDNDPYYCITAVSYWGSCDWLTGECLPSAEFPEHSSIEYLFQGALWIGGIVEGDTIVCIGEDGWAGGIHQFFPSSNPADTIQELSLDEGDPGAVSNQDFIAIYTDTVTNPDFVPEGHIPIGLNIKQSSHSWRTSPLDNIILIDYVLENISEYSINDMYVGLYFDGDVGYIGRYEYAQDDITGFISSYVDTFTVPHDTIHVNTAWIADNNGDPEEEEFTERSPRGACAVKVLKAPNPGIDYSYNWWISNVDEDFDWGPDEIPFEPFDGTPEGLKNKYIIMSNGEFDYDQARISDYLDDPDWLAPPENWRNLQNGYDTRFLLSFGPFDLMPGDSLPFTFALLFVDAFHTDPTLDPSEVDPENFEYLALAELSHGVLEFYESGYTYIPFSPPSGLVVVGVYENAVQLKWRPVDRDDIEGVNLYRRISHESHSSSPIATTLPTDSIFWDTTVTNAVTYHYALTSSDTMGRESRFSGEVTAVPGTPTVPTNLTGVTNPRYISVHWATNPEEDIIGYSLEKSIPEMSIYTSHFTPDTFFIDTAIYRGEWTYYRIRAQDADGLYSRWTGFLSIVPLGNFNMGLLLVDATEYTSPLGNAPEDSVDLFYQRLIGEHSDYTLWDVELSHYPDLGVMSDFSSVIWYDEDRENNLRSQDLDNLADYLYFGGNLWLCGRKISFLYNSDDSVLFKYFLGVTNLFIPPSWTVGDTGEFIGAQSLRPEFPDLVVDTLKLGQAFYGPFSTGGTIPEISYFETMPFADPLYSFQARHTDSPYNDQTCGVSILEDDYKLFYFDFPLYFLEEEPISNLALNILDEFGELESAPEIYNHMNGFKLYQNFPNPFNSSTTISFLIPEAPNTFPKVKLSVYNILGDEVSILLNGKIEPGRYSITWNATNYSGSKVSSGIYFYKLTCNSTSIIKRCLLIQ